MFRGPARVLLLAVCAAWFLDGEKAEGRASRLPTIPVHGRLYVRVADVAQHYGMQVEVSGPTLSLRSPWASLVLEVDKREAFLNGVRVWLNSPPIVRQGRTLLSHTDVVTVIEPVLSPPRHPKPAPFRAIVVDPGHGGTDQGTRSASGTLEKTVTLDVSLRLQRILANRGFVVTLTRGRDTYLSLDQRVAIARQMGADLLVSVHFNAEGSGRSARGIETYCLTPSGSASTASIRALDATLPGNRFDSFNMLLAYQVQRFLLASSGAPDRGVRRARFYVLQHAPCPAILVECGFLSNPAEAERIATGSYRERLAQGIADGIGEYKRLVER